jgi:TolB-like protein/tRNA A-37 threonylcarbamoyl transferase component Bud32
MTETVERLRTVLATRYTVEREIGRGGMAIVYLARDLKHDRQVAIKILRPDLAQSLGPARFVREIRIASQLTHPNILPVYDSGTADGFLYYVMPYVVGESLRERLLRQGQLQISDAVRIAREVAEALAYAHQAAVIHRDVKPGNILLESDHAVIADFGLARAVHAAALDDLSSAGLALGTPAYMSPEQASGSSNVDGRGDIYSLGCVLYEMLAGEPPFTGSSAQSIAAKHLQLPPPPLRTLRPQVPASIVAVVERALQKVPADRYQDAGQLAHALANAELSSPRGRLRSALGWGALLLGTTVTGIVLVDYGNRNGKQAVSSPASTSAGTRLDPTHIAVLYFDAEGQDTALKWVANGLTEDLIDQLGQVEALSVISANGVRPYRGRAAPPDSTSRALSVGTLVTGTVAGSLERPRVTVRMIDASGRQIDSRVVETTAGDVFDLRAELSQQVAAFLRERLGQEVNLRRSRSGGNPRAWVQVRRVEELREDARALHNAGDTSGARRSLDVADSLLSMVEQRAPDWVDPVVLRGWIAADRIDLVQGATGTAVKRWAAHGIAHANRALSRDPYHLPALELRGKLRLLLWEYSGQGDSSVFQSAERDLRAAAAPDNPTQAQAWSVLSYLLLRKGSFAEANLAAKRAYRVDAFLLDAPAILFRLYYTSVLLRDWRNAATWCDQGYARFPQDWLFSFCRLCLLWMPSGKDPDVRQAWRLVSEMEQKTAPSDRVVLAPRWRMIVAGVLARSGQVDSARRTLHAARAAGNNDPELDYYEIGVRLLLGERGEALRLAERYLKYDPTAKAYFRGDPLLDALRNSPAFQRLVTTSEARPLTN